MAYDPDTVRDSSSHLLLHHGDHGLRLAGRARIVPWTPTRWFGQVSRIGANNLDTFFPLFSPLVDNYSDDSLISSGVYDWELYDERKKERKKHYSK